jgi:hypothetical protein
MVIGSGVSVSAMGIGTTISDNVPASITEFTLNAAMQRD